MSKHAYKLISGYTPDNLQDKVNFFISSLDTTRSAAQFVGPPQVFGNSEYVQAMEVFTNVD